MWRAECRLSKLFHWALHQVRWTPELDPRWNISGCFLQTSPKKNLSGGGSAGASETLMLNCLSLLLLLPPLWVPFSHSVVSSLLPLSFCSKPPPRGQHLNHNCVTSHNRSHAQQRQRRRINPPGRLEGWRRRRRWIITISLFAEHFAGELFTACLCLPRSDEAAAPPRTGEASAKQTQRMGQRTQTVATIRKKQNQTKNRTFFFLCKFFFTQNQMNEWMNNKLQDEKVCTVSASC